jgi:hypothetical protein
MYGSDVAASNTKSAKSWRAARRIPSNAKKFQGAKPELAVGIAHGVDSWVPKVNVNRRVLIAAHTPLH